MPRHILFVDDDADTCEMMRVFLSSLGYKVTTAGSYSLALNLIQNETFDLFMLDSWMETETAGIELCELIRSFDISVPVFFLTGAVRATDQEAAFKAGATAFFKKPLDFEGLISAIELSSVESLATA